MPKQELVNYASRLTPKNHEQLKAYATQYNVSANTALNALLDWALQTVRRKEWGISVNMGIEQSRKPRQPRQKSAPLDNSTEKSRQMELPTSDDSDDFEKTKSLDECETHQDLIVYAAQNDKPRSWAFGQAKQKDFEISLSITEQDEIWDNNRSR